MKKKTALLLVFVTAAVFMISALSPFAANGGGIAGDVNTDGKVNNKDVVVLFRISSGGDPGTDLPDMTAADCTGDGKINNKDVVTLFRAVSGSTDVRLYYGPKTETYDFEKFDEDLLDFISKKTDENFMISPLSFKYALGMLLAGAGGDTLIGLKDALGIAELSELEDVIKDFTHFTEGFEANYQAELERFRDEAGRGWIPEDTPEPYRALRPANSVWKRDNIYKDFKEDYKTRLQMYDAEMRTFDTGHVINDVNAWANEKTEGMIKDLLPDDYDVTNLAIVLMNALYFKDNWVTAFDGSDPFELDFTTAAGETVRKTFMKAEITCRYYKDDQTELVCVPMDGRVEMVFLLGSTEGAAQKIAEAKYTDVAVTVPMFETETALNSGELCEFLAQRGAFDAFGNSADFSAMIDWDISVSDIVQKTKIKIDQYGVEAAAVTAILMPDKAFDPGKTVKFTADRAFTYYIVTADSDWAENAGTVMFEGRLVK
ncbi:MAG: hypothetical protein J5879_03030 [Clostridia bacterium]|nr:hypothetical protein [Clostridia bacterium]